MKYFGISENPLVHQVALTKDELEKIFNGTPNVEMLSPEDGANILTEAEEKAILDAKDPKLVWKVGKVSGKTKTAKCSNLTCKASMPEDKIYVEVDGWYIPPGQRFAVERTFYFCASFECMKHVRSSNIVPPSVSTMFEMKAETTLKAEDKELLTYRGFNFSD